MERLPEDIQKYILLYFNPLWLCVCSRKYARQFFTIKRHADLVKWHRLYKRKEMYLNMLRENKDTRRALQSRYFFKNFREYDDYQKLLVDCDLYIIDLKYDINNVHCMLQKIANSINSSMKYLQSRYRDMQSHHPVSEDKKNENPEKL